MATSDQKPRDVHLTLCLTHDCNLRCRYCYAGTKLRRHMTLATGREAIDLALRRTSKRLHLVFFGGEPLLQWRTLVNLTSWAKARTAEHSLSLHPAVTTNATLLTDAYAAWLAEHDFVVAASCDGCKPAHDANRLDARGQSSYAATIQGIRSAIHAGLPVRAIMVVDPSNVDYLTDSVDALCEIGVRDFVLNPNWSGDWSDAESRSRWSDAYLQLHDRYVQSYRDGSPLWLSPFDTKITSHIKGGNHMSDRCDLGRHNLVVAPSGNLYPCDRMVGDDLDDRFVIGHVASGTDPRRVRDMVQPTTALADSCQQCSVTQRCRNRCACANLALTGRLHEPSDLLCFYEQMCIQLADQAAGLLHNEANPDFLRRHYRLGV